MQCSSLCHFGEIDFFLENMKWQTILHIFMTSLYSKKLSFVKLKKQNVVCAYEFSWFAKKVILGISPLILGAIFGENKFFSKSEKTYFSALFHIKIILK